LLIRKGKRAGFLLIGEEGDDHGLMYGFLKREAKRYGEGNVLTGAADLDLSQLGEVYSPPTFFRRYERKFEPYELAELLRIKK